jgi:hypothetical protein
MKNKKDHQTLVQDLLDREIICFSQFTVNQILNKKNREKG